MSEPIFTCEAQVLAKALKDVSGLNRGKDNTGILKNVLVEVKGDTAKLTATNMECAITRMLPVESEQDGAITIELDKFRDIVSTFPGGAQARVASDKGWAVLTSGRSKSKYATLPAQDFPPMAFDKPLSDFAVGQDFVGALSRVRHAISVEDTRYFLLGVSLRWHEKRLDVAATDGSRLALNVLDAPEVSDAILPSAAVERLLALASDASEIGMALTETMVRWSFGATSITHKLIDGQFPDYRRLIRAESPINAKIDADDMDAALARILLLSDDKERTAIMSFTPDSLTVRSRGMANEGSDDMTSEHSGDPLDIAIATKFLRDALGSLDADAVTFGMHGSRDPVMITAASRPDAIMVVMPKSS